MHISFSLQRQIRLLSVPTWQLKINARIELSHAEKISAQELTIQLERTWACKFHIQALGCVKRRREEESINKSALSEIRRSHE